MSKKYDEYFFKFMTIARNEDSPHKRTEEQIIDRAIELANHFIEKAGFDIIKPNNEGVLPDMVYDFIKNERPLGISQTDLSRRYRTEDSDHLKQVIKHLISENMLSKKEMPSLGGRRKVVYTAL